MTLPERVQIIFHLQITPMICVLICARQLYMSCSLQLISKIQLENIVYAGTRICVLIDLCELHVFCFVRGMKYSPLDSHRPGISQTHDLSSRSVNGHGAWDKMLTGATSFHMLRTSF